MNTIPYKCFVKWVGTISHEKIRLFRIVWSRKGGPGNGGWSAKFSVNLVPRLFAWYRDRFDFYLTILGVQFHKQRHCGGWIS